MKTFTEAQLVEAQRILQSEKAKKRWENVSQEQKNAFMKEVRTHRKTKTLDK